MVCCREEQDIPDCFRVFLAQVSAPAAHTHDNRAGSLCSFHTEVGSTRRNEHAESREYDEMSNARVRCRSYKGDAFVVCDVGGGTIVRSPVVHSLRQPSNIRTGSRLLPCPATEAGAEDREDRPCLR